MVGVLSRVVHIFTTPKNFPSSIEIFPKNFSVTLTHNFKSKDMATGKPKKKTAKKKSTLTRSTKVVKGPIKSRNSGVKLTPSRSYTLKKKKK